jgi:8-oxo-dGTP pyrophosphatase MutT (NUDIX family)
MSQKPRIVVGILGIPIKDQQFLLSLRHSPRNPLAHHKWQLIGGGLEFGETPEQTLAREFQEEVQLPVHILHPHPIVKTSIWEKGEDGSNSDFQVVLISYICEVGDGTPNCENDEETADVRWFTLPEIMELDCLPNTKEMILEANEIFKKN